MLAGLPHADHGAAGIGQHRHRAEVAHRHRLDEHLAAVGLGDLHGLLGVVDREVHRPHVGHALLLGRHETGHGLTVEPEVGVATELRVRLVGRPPEQLAVEGPALARCRRT